MHLECHFALGWTLGNVFATDRKLRNYTALGALLPDADGLPIIFGIAAYGRMHHTFGHSLFTWLLFAAWVTWRCRSARAFWLSFVSFGSHLLTDAGLSGWDLRLFWPFSHEGFLLPGAVGLEAPINTLLVYVSVAVIVLLAFIYKRTPFDIVSPRFDQLVTSGLRAKELICGICSAKCNQRCDTCGQPVCSTHGILRKKLKLVCPDCKSKRSPPE